MPRHCVAEVDDLRAVATADAKAISPPSLSPPREPIPGRIVSGSLWLNERFVVRVPRAWNGRLVVAGTPGQRTELACDLLWSNPLLARGYAYACGNKVQGDGVRVLTGDDRLEIGGIAMPRYVAADGSRLSFWQHAPGNTLARWIDEFFELTRTAHAILEDAAGRAPETTYAVGLSNGGAQVRWALERSDVYAGGLAWNAVLWSVEHNLLRQLPFALAAMRDGVPSDLSAIGIPPNVYGRSGGSLYERNLVAYWDLTAWLYATLFDPQTSIPYGDVSDPAPAEGWNGTMGTWRFDRSPAIATRVGEIAHTGRIRAKLIDLASASDHLIAPAMHFEPYARLIESAGATGRYRARVIPDAQHVDAWSEDPDYPQMRPGHAHALAAFDELVRWVEG